MIVRSHNVEFGYELIATLPYAYWHKLNGSLSETVSGKGSEPLYFFSPKHTIDPSPRDFKNTAAAALETPNMRIHTAELNTRQWTPPPLAEHYQKEAIVFEKPTVVVYNRYNYEWQRPPINFFDLPTLRGLFDLLTPKYTVVYFNVRGEEALEDNAHSMHLGDFEMIRQEYPEVKVIHDLVAQSGQDYNTVQLRVFAGCRRFITMNGGPSILASYFGGENIIYTKYCQEIKPAVGSFYGWYHLFNPNDPSHVRVVNSYDQLLSSAKTAWVDETPLLNILVRCHNRPLGFKRLLDSIASQGYPNVRVICSYDNKETLRYLTSEKVVRLKATDPERKERPNSEEYKAWLGANDYLNQLARYVTGGYIMYMDDDDVMEPGSIRSILSNSSPGHVLLWRCAKRDGSVVPSDENMGKIVAGDISGIAVCYHYSHKGKATWTPWRRGDYRFIRDLCSEVELLFIPDVLTRMAPRIGTASGESREAQMNRIRLRALRKMSEKQRPAPPIDAGPHTERSQT